MLISITGGRDLTLFEVDEAATRIREEVDSEANIILGATFEESLDGIIRVSVVATGIDRAAQTEAERFESGRVSAAISRSTAAQPQSRPVNVGAAPLRPAPQPMQRAPQALAGQPARPASVPSIAPAPAQPARFERDGVNIEPMQPETMFTADTIEEEFRVALEVELAPASDDFIPPAPEMPETGFAPARMPEVQDFPPMVQAEIEKRSAGRPQHEERGGSMGGLLKKLAHNFGVREEEPEQTRTAPRAQTRVEPQARPAQPAPAAGHGRVDDNPFAPKRTTLDRHGRITPGEKAVSEDDQLEIPAFLRRQSS